MGSSQPFRFRHARFAGGQSAVRPHGKDDQRVLEIPGFGGEALEFGSPSFGVPALRVVRRLMGADLRPVDHPVNNGCALGVGDFLWMSKQFFSNQSLGFLLAGLGLMLHVLKKERTYGFLPTMALVGIMVVGLCALDAGLCFQASKLKKRNALLCFILSFFLCLGMGYLSSKDFDKAFMNWIAQFINVFGQGLYFTGIRILDKAGLKDVA